MTNVEKVNAYLDEAKMFYFLTTDGDQPKGRPFTFHMLVKTTFNFSLLIFNCYRVIARF